MGASSSRRFGWAAKISRDAKQSCLISDSASCTSFPGFEDRTSISFSIILSNAAGSIGCPVVHHNQSITSLCAFSPFGHVRGLFHLFLSVNFCINHTLNSPEMERGMPWQVWVPRWPGRVSGRWCAVEATEIVMKTCTATTAAPENEVSPMNASDSKCDATPAAWRWIHCFLK
ncbi:RNA-binding (RRM/RBD/RNP motifs) family protein [Striga asiatica]|uniref:RNA-binding (RRM/RBD/RNP motifs) family protein n=1 Tax=Striga asiatica TaxID=4170 RepID=A0A5A7P0G7_STRAF|nr:RNA-binding (RRM/RBD/RNP motifs) family protein [Striga asiatica]